MPLYEYECTKCHHRFEVTHHVGGSAGTCPVCGGPPRRIFSSIGLVFKGSGFHTTDYRRPSSPDGAGATGKAEAKPGTSESPKPSTPST